MRPAPEPGQPTRGYRAGCTATGTTSGHWNWRAPSQWRAGSDLDDDQIAKMIEDCPQIALLGVPRIRMLASAGIHLRGMVDIVRSVRRNLAVETESPESPCPRPRTPPALVAGGVPPAPIGHPGIQNGKTPATGIGGAPPSPPC